MRGSGRKGKSKASFPIPTHQLARNLIYIYARLKGEIAKADDRQDMMIPFVQVKEYMRFIQHLMPLLRVDFDPRAIAPVRSRILDGPLKHGQVRIGALKVLKKHGDWMSCRQIAEAVLSLHQMVLTPALKIKFVKVMNESLFYQYKAGTLEREFEPKVETAPGADRRPHHQRYRLSQKRFRPRPQTG